MASSSWEDRFTCKWTQEGQLDIKGFPTDMPKCLQFYLVSVSRANKWARALQLIQEEEGHCFISGIGVSFPLDYESSSSEEDQPSRGPLPEDEVEFFSGTFSKDRVNKSVFLRTVEKCLVERHKICGPLEGEEQFVNHVSKQTKPRHATDQVSVPLGGLLGMKRSASVDGNQTMADGDNIDGVLDLTGRAQGSLSQNIGKLQELISQREEFQKVAKYFDKVPEWSSEEGRNFFEMMKHIKHACDSYGQVLGGTRRYVISARAFAKDTVTFTTDVQKDDLEPDDIEDIFGDFTDSINKMKESNKQVVVLREDFRSVLMRLRDAQTEAAGGQLRGMKKPAEADTHVGYGILGTVGTGVATVVTLGAAAPFVLVGAGYTWKSGKDAEKCKEWENAFNFVLRRLDDLYSVLDSITNECTNVLDQLSHSSKDIMDKSKRMTDRKKLATSRYMKRKCTRLAEESAELERACIEYIRKDEQIPARYGIVHQVVPRIDSLHT